MLLTMNSYFIFSHFYLIFIKGLASSCYEMVVKFLNGTFLNDSFYYFLLQFIHTYGPWVWNESIRVKISTLNRVFLSSGTLNNLWPIIYIFWSPACALGRHLRPSQRVAFTNLPFQNYLLFLYEPLIHIYYRISLFSSIIPSSGQGCKIRSLTPLILALNNCYADKFAM